MKRVYLVGYMGAGKSSIAKRLANKIGWISCDLDLLFEERYKISVDDFFAKYDEIAFRKLESDLLKQTESMENVIISTGGGTPCFFDNMTWMNENGLTVFIEISPLTAVNRLKQSKKKRPLLSDKNKEQLLDFVQHHYGERMKFYRQAQLTVKGESCDVDELVEKLKDINNSLS